MWISKFFFGEVEKQRAQVEFLTAELARSTERERAARDTHDREVIALRATFEAKIATERALRYSAEGRVKMLENSFEWLSTSHERLERWFAEMMHAKAHVAIPVSTMERTGPLLGIPAAPDTRPVSEGVRETGDEPGGLEELYRRNSGALFEDVGDAIAAREGISGVEYQGIEPIAQG